MGLLWFQGAKADLNDGLVAYYPFNGNANDESGNGHHGTVNGATLTEDRFGNADNAYSFNGVSDYIKIADTPNLSGFQAITLSAWFSNKGELKNTYQGIITKWFQVAANKTIREQDTYGMSINSDRIHGFTNNHCCRTASGNFPTMEQWVYATFIHTQ